ncbi:tyrosine phosphatase family protein [Rhodoligotrophos defluvii]|uniref:tyrosine phosphatase family protein n=1 Tax=Rhodoligotrophos defluvii TaxID=2561934 RepID=UPI0010CA14D9|nr:protein-tyrosine phosphatase family protein [Rhodoligotrophos defluvii]
MPRIIVSPLSAVETAAAAYKPSHVVTLLGPTAEPVVVGGVPATNHLRLTFNDIAIAMEGLVCPTADHAQSLISFIQAWPRQHPILIHCWAGISRSTAAAYAALCAHLPEENEMSLAKRLREASPTATPNRLIVALADDILGRGGRMVDAVDHIGRGREAPQGEVFLLDVNAAEMAAS